MNKLKPYYKQIADELERDILSNKFRPGSRMPTEREIQDRFYVSRMTVRQAYRLLEEKGVADIIKNKGVFVKDARLQREQPILSYKEMINKSGIENETKVITLDKIVPSNEVREKLELEFNEEVYYLERHRFIKSELILIEAAHIPVKKVPNLEKYDFSKESLYEVLENQYGLKIINVKEVISADLIGGNEARIMLTSKSGPALRIRTTSLDENGAPIKYIDTIANYRVFSYKAFTNYANRHEQMM